MGRQAEGRVEREVWWCAAWARSKAGGSADDEAGWKAVAGLAVGLATMGYGRQHTRAPGQANGSAFA